MGLLMQQLFLVLDFGINIEKHTVSAKMRLLFCLSILWTSALAALSPNIAQDMRITCNDKEIHVSIDTNSERFTGMIYPRGLSKNSTCLMEFTDQKSPVQYTLPLRSCNTMSTSVDGGEVEYFNTIVVQPHRKLVTNQGQGFHVRCRYRAHPSEPELQSLVAPSEDTPTVAMRIYNHEQVAENVKIGDLLTMTINLEGEDVQNYGLHVTNCVVRDGLSWGEQRLVDADGCPMDQEIMGPFEYAKNLTSARVQFKAHKFPYTASVYYQCRVVLCTQYDGGCTDVTPICSDRKSRQRRANEEGAPATIQVYSGLYVNEASDSGESAVDQVLQESARDDPNVWCISQRTFAITIAVAGLILMLLVLLAVCVLLTKKSYKDISTNNSSIYSGPYSNHAYTHSS
ncbi:hypothetical protein M8J75_001945 [Diaphorina citri]|nr:hypothetical protein M8J75_001945 [Diaphorina citri]